MSQTFSAMPGWDTLAVASRSARSVAISAAERLNRVPGEASRRFPASSRSPLTSGDPGSGSVPVGSAMIPNSEMVLSRAISCPEVRYSATRPRGACRKMARPTASSRSLNSLTGYERTSPTTRRRRWSGGTWRRSRTSLPAGSAAGAVRAAVRPATRLAARIPTARARTIHLIPAIIVGSSARAHCAWGTVGRSAAKETDGRGSTPRTC